MNENAFQEAMRDATAAILNDPAVKLFGGGRPDSRRAVDAYDVNCGLCEEWAEDVRRRYKAVTGQDDVEVLDPGNLTGDPNDSLSGHVFIRFMDRFYDAETPEGVTQWQHLPLFKKQCE
jgi:hypothetical protein